MARTVLLVLGFALAATAQGDVDFDSFDDMGYNMEDEDFDVAAGGPIQMGLTEKELDAVFEGYDRDQNGFLGKEEMASWLGDDVRNRTKDMDAATLEEVSGFTEADFLTSAGEFIHEGDTNGDALLSRGELSAVMISFDEDLFNGH